MPVSLFLPPCTIVKHPSVFSMPCPWMPAGWWWDTPCPSLSWLCRCSHNFLSWNLKGEARRCVKNTSLDDFQSQKTVEIISLLLKISENFKSGAQKTFSTWKSKTTPSLSWAPWSGSVKDLQALFVWYLNFLLSKYLYTVHLKNEENSFPFFPPQVSIIPDSMAHSGYPNAAFQPGRHWGRYMWIHTSAHAGTYQDLYINNQSLKTTRMTTVNKLSEP